MPVPRPLPCGVRLAVQAQVPYAGLKARISGPQSGRGSALGESAAQHRRDIPLRSPGPSGRPVLFDASFLPNLPPPQRNETKGFAVLVEAVLFKLP